MAITSSRVESDVVQVDGRRSILEIHTDDTGKDFHRVYKASANYVVNLSAAAAIVSAERVNAEDARVRNNQYRRAHRKIKQFLRGSDLRTLCSLTPAENTVYRKMEFDDG